MLIDQFIIGALLIGLTVIVHAVALDRLMAMLESWGPRLFKKVHRFWRIALLVIAVFGTFFSHIVQIWIWAGFYILIGEMHELEKALYFSTSTYTTAGYGDIVLSEKWRLISSFQAANGFIVFGWSTAFIFEVMSKLYRGETIQKTEKRNA